MREAIAVSSNIYFYTIGGGYEDQPGLGPLRIKKYLDLLEIDATDIMLEGMPSITAINGMMSRGMMGGAMSGFAQGIGGPNDPNQQGPAGQTNAASTQKNEPGGQPAYPAQ